MISLVCSLEIYWISLLFITNLYIWWVSLFFITNLHISWISLKFITNLYISWISFWCRTICDERTFSSDLSFSYFLSWLLCSRVWRPHLCDLHPLNNSLDRLKTTQEQKEQNTKSLRGWWHLPASRSKGMWTPSRNIKQTSWDLILESYFNKHTLQQSHEESVL